MPTLRPVRARLPARVRVWLTALLALLSGYVISTARQAAVRPPLVLGQDSVPPNGAAPSRVTLEDVGGRAIVITPIGREVSTLLVLYPGGLVRPQAYEWLGRALTERGVQTVIPVFPLDLAVTGVNRADAVIARYGQGRRVVIAGHSLGGAMAAQYASGHPDTLDGLILMAAYPAGNVDLKGRRLPALSLLAEEDGVAAETDVRDGLARLPDGSTLTVIPGAVHAFFGRYGPQKGDGRPTVTRAQAESAIVQAVTSFLDRIDP
ncbi:MULTISPECIES: alpha/beta fold hydrolase [Deinococcus]|uniref:Alpha/beta fold hydrolase n=1 Tax=Deinococcus rufus TaxID=2136097 RepID=A0ABV7ZCA0_9DEIO|nr:alpha/beta fold hydrolase [Deinococcus sp. AB2017081]WQE93860.1 alpha/beta hydrolase [Deinococcus sp. AB2017081]